MRRFNIRSWMPMKAVYSFVFPETWNVLHDAESIIDIRLFRTGTTAARAQKLLEPHFPGLVVPATAFGGIDLDEIHRPIMARVVGAYSNQVIGLEGFANTYPTSGSSEGIFHLLSKMAREGVKTIHTVRGEYEGYREQGKNLGLETKSWALDDPAIDALPPGTVWYISNPCARDGNILPDSFIEKLCALGHRLVLDLAYVGATRPHRFDVTHPNIEAVVMSFSKPYGTFRFRIGGFVFAREALPTLYGNKWFKDVQRLFQALALAEKIGPEGLYPKYRPVQEAIIAKLNRKYDLGLVASDSLLLATMPASQADGLTAEQHELIAPFRREDVYRFCLTPYFEQAVPASQAEFTNFAAARTLPGRKSKARR